MDYGDVLRKEREMKFADVIGDIYANFEIDADDITRACAAAGVRYPDEPIQYYFLAVCIRKGTDLKDDYGIEDDDMSEIHDAAVESADGAVPYQTYIVWRLWIEFGYETNAYDSMGLQPTLDNLENVAQVELMHYAERIIYEFADE